MKYFTVLAFCAFTVFTQPAHAKQPPLEGRAVSAAARAALDEYTQVEGEARSVLTRLETDTQLADRVAAAAKRGSKATVSGLIKEAGARKSQVTVLTATAQRLVIRFCLGPICITIIIEPRPPGPPRS